jgi:uncharacterized protein DUF6491
MLLLSAALASAASLAADAPPVPAAKSSTCFRPDQFQSWRAPNAATIYIRVFPNRYYRLDLAGQCPEILQPDSHLDTKFDGTNMVCEALDWNMKVSGPFRIGQSCIVKAMTALSPAEVKAIPKEFRP